MTTGHPAASRRDPATLRLCGGLFLISLAVYLLTANGHLLGQDQEYYYRMAQAVALEHTFAIEPPFPTPAELAAAQGTVHRVYAQYPPGLPLALAPVVVAGRALSGPVGRLKTKYTWPADNPSDLGARFLVSYANAPITAATVALLALLVLRLGYSAPAAAFVGLTYGLGTLAWGQARVLFPDPLQGLLLLVACLFLLRCNRYGAFAGGVALALAMLVKQTAGAAVLAFLFLPNYRGQPLWRSPRIAVFLLAPFAAAGGAFLLYDVLRFGGGLGGGISTLIPSGLQVGNPVVGVYGLILSAGKGILWFAPPIVASLLAYRRFLARRPAEAIAFYVLIGLWLLTYSILGSGVAAWSGGWGWGPRYLLPVLPFALLPLAEWWAFPRARIALIALSVIGLAIQLPGAMVDFMETGRQATLAFARMCTVCSSAAIEPWRDFVPAGSDIAMQSGMLRSGQIDLAWVTFSDTWVRPTTLLLAIVFATVGAFLCGDVLWKPRRAAGSWIPRQKLPWHWRGAVRRSSGRPPKGRR